MPKMSKSDVNKFYATKYGGKALPKAIPKLRKRRKDIEWDKKLYQLNEYRVSDAWRAMCQRIKDRDGHECRVCGNMQELEVHHMTYANLYNEPLHHLITLCHSCHHAIHYDDKGKRRRDWKRWNPKPVLDKPASK